LYRFFFLDASVAGDDNAVRRVVNGEMMICLIILIGQGMQKWELS
jgi:hypothetical protein